jgi:hypothetical protein
VYILWSHTHVCGDRRKKQASSAAPAPCAEKLALTARNSGRKLVLSKRSSGGIQAPEVENFFFAFLAAVLCELCGYKLFVFAVSAFKNKSRDSARRDFLSPMY